ncbi:MAG: hypothetical protein AMS26_22910 [Bacteroides sp. SM23_62]|nr:MAG: hypothetical protein AMS26_22910 [Bacteroides sp. SM23_62]
MLTLKKSIINLLLVHLIQVLTIQAQSVHIGVSGTTVSLQNNLVGFEFDLSRGTYGILKVKDHTAVVTDAKLRINDWSSDDPGMKRSWEEREVSDPFGKGLALDLRFEAENTPAIRFTFVIYENQGFISATGGITNTTDQSLQVKELYVMADGILYDGVDMTENFAMVDGFSGGEPLEYGRRFYSPLTRRNALKSRNNILLTFTEDQQRHSLVMGGLTYHDFEKFAAIEQSRRIELELGRDSINSLLCYLDLPAQRSDRSPGGEILELIKGSDLRTWQYHEFRCTETATSVMESDEIIIEAVNIKQERAYTLGFSWWNGLWYGDHPDLYQSVFVEFDQDGVIQKLPLLEDHPLPRFDGVKKQDVEQLELALPADAIRAGKFRIIIEKAGNIAEKKPGNPAGQNESVDEHVYLSEIWLRDGTSEPFLSGEPTPVSESPRPRRSFKAQLCGKDPVGKRVDPDHAYLARDQYYIDVTEPDPFIALENYGLRVRKAQEVNLSMYDFPTVCLWYAEASFFGGSNAENTTLGAVNEMKRIVESGFLKYCRAAVRLVPDSYMPDNQQGWWDDEHWQREDTDLNVSKNGRYVKPYETSEKWGKAVTALGGIPLTYFQTSYRSEDYAREFPGHMLFNKCYAWKGEPVDTNSEIFTSWNKTWTRNGRVVWGYDYTDPDFLAHMNMVYDNLKAGGIKGLMFDYPASGWASQGGMEDQYATCAAAYRNIFRLAYDGLGPGSYVHERNMVRGSDISIGLVSSMRTENDTDEMDGSTVTRCGLRWYKNRVIVNQDTDSKNLARLQDNRDQVRAVLTMSYVTSGRLLLANSFSQFSPETLWDLTRTFPYHTTPKSARPVDAFVAEFPAVYDFEVDPQWHQVTFYNPDLDSARHVGIDMSGKPVDGALGLDVNKTYYVFDFWNNHFIGKVDGASRLEQQLRPGEARMMSVRECMDHPQVLSTNRHVMQGYLDVVSVEWDEGRSVLTGVSKVIGGDPYTLSVALNGYNPGVISCENQDTKTTLASKNDGLIQLTMESLENDTVKWFVSFEKNTDNN